MDGGDNDKYVSLKDYSDVHPFDSVNSFSGNKIQSASDNNVFHQVNKSDSSKIVNNKVSNNINFPQKTPQCTLVCSCRTTLAYTQGALSVICPVCNSINKVIQYLRCGSCSTILQFPAGAQYVKCVCKALNTNPYFKNN